MFRKIRIEEIDNGYIVICLHNESIEKVYFDTLWKVLVWKVLGHINYVFDGNVEIDDREEE